MFRQGVNLEKEFNCEVLIFVHHKDSDQIFSLNSGPNFDLAKVQELLIEDAKKLKRYKLPDYELIK